MARYGMQRRTIKKCYKELLTILWQCFGESEFKISQFPWWLEDHAGKHTALLVKPIQRGYVMRLRRDGSVYVYKISACVIDELRGTKS